MSFETLIESGDGTAQPALGIKTYQNVIGEFLCNAGYKGSRLGETELPSRDFAFRNVDGPIVELTQQAQAWHGASQHISATGNEFIL